MNEQHKMFLDKLIPLAEQYGKGINNGDAKTANKACDRICGLLTETDADVRKILLPPLCAHKNGSVRLWAATYLFEEDEELALSTIERIIKEGTVLGLTAEVTLDMWKAGTLKLESDA